MKALTIITLFAASLSATANARAVYVLSVTNGGVMPLSPAVAYTIAGQNGSARIGQEAAPGFVELCQMGGAQARLMELQQDSSISFSTATTSMIQPGETRDIEVSVEDPKTQSIQFETMYGKTKDLCAVASFNSHSLVALEQHVTTQATVKDDVVQTGAFQNPMLPMGRTYLDMNVCAAAMDAVSCLRQLAMPAMMRGPIRLFNGYSPSVLMLLERKYGSAQTEGVSLSPSGAVRLELKLKH